MRRVWVSAIASALGSFLLAGPILGQGSTETPLYRQWKTTVVKIDPTFSDPERQKRAQAGSGVLISPTGHILTALHVIGGEEHHGTARIRITIINERNQAMQLAGLPKILNIDPKLDLAVLQMTGDYLYGEISTAPLAGSPQLTAIFWNAQQRDNVPLPLKGTLSVPDPGLEGDRIKLELKVIPGNSGAPVFDEFGKIVAIITNQKDAADDRYSLATPMSSAEKFLPTRSPQEQQICIGKERARRTEPRSLHAEAAIECTENNQHKSEVAEIPAPERHTIASLAAHDDETNEYGWVGAVEYEEEEDGRISSSRVRVHCMTSNSGSKGWAKTRLSVLVQPILSPGDNEGINRGCITR